MNTFYLSKRFVILKKNAKEFMVAMGFDTGLLVGLQDKIIWNVINGNRL